MMTRVMLTVLATCLAACAGAPTEVLISVTAQGDALTVTNATDGAWEDAHLTVQSREEGEGRSGELCADDDVGTWHPGQSRVVPWCGDKTLIRVDTAGGSGEFIWAKERLFRKIGRKEIPLG
jgi:hypothetical protein